MPRLTSYIVILLALVSFAQAGPFGLKNGMTVDEIIEAGFESNFEKISKINDFFGRPSVPYKTLAEIKDGKSPRYGKSYYDTYTVNKKHPKKYFNLMIDPDFGLIYVGIRMHPVDLPSLNILADEYTKKIAEKYGGKIRTEKYEATYNFQNNHIATSFPAKLSTLKPLVTDQIRDIKVTKQYHTEWKFFKLGINYYFVNFNLWLERRRLDKEKEKQEKIKDLLPKEEDL